MTPERAWDEYLRWTRGSHEGQYEITEERAWERLQVALMLEAVDQRPKLQSPQSNDPTPRA